jgi:hypothetical protein
MLHVMHVGRGRCQTLWRLLIGGVLCGWQLLEHGNLLLLLLQQRVHHSLLMLLHWLLSSTLLLEREGLCEHVLLLQPLIAPQQVQPSGWPEVKAAEQAAHGWHRPNQVEDLLLCRLVGIVDTLLHEQQGLRHQALQVHARVDAHNKTGGGCEVPGTCVPSHLDK